MVEGPGCKLNGEKIRSKASGQSVVKVCFGAGQTMKAKQAKVSSCSYHAQQQHLVAVSRTIELRYLKPWDNMVGLSTRASRWRKTRLDHG